MQIDRKTMNEMAFSIGQMTFVANNQALREMLSERGISSDDLESLKDLTRKIAAALLANRPETLQPKVIPPFYS